MDLLSNGYGFIRKRSKTLKQSLFDWMLHKFNALLTRTMSDIPSSSRPRRRPTFQLDEELETSDDSSHEELYVLDEDSNNSNENVQYCDSENDEIDESSSHSWRSTASSEKSISENSELEKTSKVQSSLSNNEEKSTDSSTSPIRVKHSYGINEQVNSIVNELINEEEHEKRLKELQKELEFIKSTEWMYRPIDSSIL
ncbi:uncharacterized protein LOC126899316 isoform X2 [Daktulosphaira vitifoliae]|uniref:uncharacterized protein LOC126899316 isoform X2 n=1 Tax=Daktulosphaira vitifoliae TaxID=58002 RepID=UPI0021A9D897|nr:uncharacterized protein LOC126899316 isoform X2 [Daktulosphaira vitifoliae]